MASEPPAAPAGATRPRDPSIEPDTKDWTWVVERACPECGFDPHALRADEVHARLTANAGVWENVLTDPDAGVRPAPHIWSPLEYACHVRDVHRVFFHRVRMMLAVDDPMFDDWDQDEAALTGDYATQWPATVADDLVSAAEAVATAYRSVEGEQWQRPGRRSNGSRFTISTLALYHLHDVEHHLNDVPEQFREGARRGERARPAD